MGLWKKKEKIVDQTEQPNEEEKVKEKKEEPEKEIQLVNVFPYQEELRVIIDLLTRQNEHLEELKILMRKAVEEQK